MAIRERHKALARLFWRRLGIILLFGLVVFAGFAVKGVWQKEQESRAMRHEAEIELAELQRQEAKLSENIGELKSDRGIEAALREQYGVARKGEELVVIIESQAVQEEAPPPTVREWVRKFLPFW